MAQNVSAFLITTKPSWVFPWQIIAVLVYGKWFSKLQTSRGRTPSRPETLNLEHLRGKGLQPGWCRNCLFGILIFQPIAVNVSRPRGSQQGNAICFSRFLNPHFFASTPTCLLMIRLVTLHEFCWFDSLCFPTKLGGYGHLTLVFPRRRGDARRAGWWWRRCAAAAFESFFHMGWDQDEIKMGKWMKMM